MKKLSYKELVDMGVEYTPLSMKHIELGNIQVYDYSQSSFSELRELVKMNWAFKDPNNFLLGVRTTDKPLTEDVLYQDREIKQILILSKDNAFGALDNGSKREVEIDRDVLTYKLKNFFNWRTPTKHYNTFIDRFFGLGSYDYDRFINHLISEGY